jgi:hypothetical protein
MMQEYARVARPFFVLLAIVTVGRWLQGTVFHVPYERGTGVFSIVTLTLMAALFSALYTRRWLGWRITRAAGFGMFLAVVAQVVILLSTAASYLLGVASYFNYPLALNRPDAVGFATAMGIRLGGLVVNTILTGIAGALGWALGALLPAAALGGPAAARER